MHRSRSATRPAAPGSGRATSAAGSSADGGDAVLVGDVEARVGDDVGVGAPQREDERMSDVGAAADDGAGADENAADDVGGGAPLKELK